jgi:hypothetical protein
LALSGSGTRASISAGVSAEAVGEAAMSAALGGGTLAGSGIGMAALIASSGGSAAAGRLPLAARTRATAVVAKTRSNLIPRIARPSVSPYRTQYKNSGAIRAPIQQPIRLT